MLNELYQKTLKLAAHKRSNTFLAVLSFTESSFFPIPPYVMIAPMVIAKKNDYLKIFFIATLFSSLGGILGYFIGSYFFDLSMVVVEFYNYEEKVINLKNSLSEGNGLYIWLATLFLSLAVIISMLSGPTTNASSSIVKEAAEDRPVVPATDPIQPDGEATLDLGGN